MKYGPFIPAVLAFMAFLPSSCSKTTVRTDPDNPLLMLRFRGTTTYTDKDWDNTFRIIKENPGCCDEVWFSSGLGVPPMDVHRERASRIMRGTRELESIGVGSSLQIQMTLGHGDYLAKGEEHLYSELTWTGWTGSTGVVDRYCSCPRNPEFLKYMREMAHVYAETKPRSMWIDDDLRYHNHTPASNGSHHGCWCDRCIADFNAATNGSWTAQTLSDAMYKDRELTAKWLEFCTSSLCDIARIFAEEFVKVSPGTRLGLQGVMDESSRDVLTAILSTLHEVSGKEVCYRPGGGAYYDNANADGQIDKSMTCARFRKIMGDPDWIVEWCPEIEAWPRVYGSRTPQGVLVEGFTALAYGMNSISMFIMAPEMESDTVYSQTMLRPISKGAPMLKAYAKANEGTVPVGYSSAAGMGRLYSFARTGIPVLPGCGKDLGTLTEDDLNIPNFTTEVSGRVQQLRDRLDERSTAPVVCCSPFIGLVIPRVDMDGAIRTIGLQNVRIDAQGPIRLRIDGLPDNVSHVQWFEMKGEPVKLRVRREEGMTFVTVPELGAWNSGFLLIK